MTYEDYLSKAEQIKSIKKEMSDHIISRRDALLDYTNMLYGQKYGYEGFAEYIDIEDPFNPIVHWVGPDAEICTPPLSLLFSDDELISLKEEV